MITKKFHRKDGTSFKQIGKTRAFNKSSRSLRSDEILRKTQVPGFARK